MKITAVSGDLVVKVAVGAAVLGLAAYLVVKAKRAISDTAAAVVPYIDPTDANNVAYHTVNAVGGTLTGQKDFSLGSWIYDVTHPNEKF